MSAMDDAQIAAFAEVDDDSDASEDESLYAITIPLGWRKPNLLVHNAFGGLVELQIPLSSRAGDRLVYEIFEFGAVVEEVRPANPMRPRGAGMPQLMREVRDGLEPGSQLIPCVPASSRVALAPCMPTCGTRCECKRSCV